MIRPLLFHVICLVLFVQSVDRSNFKTCNESGFCKRQRNYNADPSPYEIILETVHANPTRLSATFINTISKAKWSLEVLKLAHQTFRVKIDELNAPKNRYKVPDGDTILEPLSEEPVHITKKEETLPNGEVRVFYHIESLGDRQERVVVQTRPLRLDFFLGDALLVSLNGQGLLNLEEQRKKPSQIATEQQPNLEGADSSSEAKQESPQPAELPDAWEETFKSHSDSKPYGPMSVGMDVLFPGFKYVYGIPTHADDLWLKDTISGEPYRLYNLDVFEYEMQSRMALYGHVPLMWAVRNNFTAGILWNNPSETWIDIKHAGSWPSLSSMLRSFSSASGVPDTGVQTHWWSETGVLDLFIFLATNPRDALFAYGALTGITPLPPYFSLAYHQSRWNYNDMPDVVDVDSKFDVYDIPYDVLWLDIEHTDGKRYFTWDKSRFPDPDAVVNLLDGKKRKLVTVIDPHIKRDDGWSFYQAALREDLFIKTSSGQSVYEGWCWPGSSSWLDFTSPRVRRWWAEQYLSYPGSRPDNTFSWNDMGEPSVFNGPEVTMHKDALHLDQIEHREVHNIYGMYIHRASWEGQLLRSNNQERPFVLTRAFFIGSQRYGAVWTGDNAAKWEHLKASMPMLLSLSISGITLVGADVGGFFGNPDAELLTRWYQAGAYQPFFRGHAHLDTKRREPWLFPKENVILIRDAIRQRYQLLPYWYTQFYLSERSNAPVMAPLWYYFSNEEDSFTLEDQFMIGPALLVKPVTDAGATHINVYLPSGRWYYQHTWQPVEGGQWHGLNVDERSIPVFYRGGFIVPRRERVRRSSSLMDRDPFSLVVALDPLTGNATGELYVDDGHSYKYRDAKQFLHLRFHFSSTDNTLRMERLIEGQGDSADVPLELERLAIERIAVLGVLRKPLRVWVLRPGSPAQPVLSSYVKDPQLVIIRKPGVLLGQKWTIRLQYEDKEKVEL